MNFTEDDTQMVLRLLAALLAGALIGYERSYHGALRDSERTRWYALRRVF
jgi:hypothetical protein